MVHWLVTYGENCLAAANNQTDTGRVAVNQPVHGPCVVWGGYGYGNTGDDLVLAVALADLRNERVGNIQILSPSPDQTRNYIRDTTIIRHPSSRPRNAWEKWFWRLTEYAEGSGITSLANRLYRMALKNPERITNESEWLKALASASQLHLTGGGYLTDRFHLRHFLRPLRLAQSRGLPVTTSSLGLGPFQKPKNAAAVAAVLRGAKLIVRDEDSLHFCEAHGLTAAEKPDDGFRWRQVVELPLKTESRAMNTIGVCIFSQHSPKWSAETETWWVNCLRTLAQSLPGFQFEGFCFHTEREMDYETTRRVFARAALNPDKVRPPQSDFRAAIVNLTRYGAVLSSRFHAVVTASEMRLPCVATALDDYYEAKMRGALKHAPVPLSILNPTRDSPRAAADWLGPRLKPISSPRTAGLRTSLP